MHYRTFTVPQCSNKQVLALFFPLLLLKITQNRSETRPFAISGHEHRYFAIHTGGKRTRSNQLQSVASNKCLVTYLPPIWVVMVQNHQDVAVIESKSCFFAGDQPVIHGIITEVGFHKHLEEKT